jgi:Co/Zn/Cd efflux system component
MLADASVYVISLLAVGKTLESKKKSASVNGYLQIILGIGILIETLRRFIYGSDPEPRYMIAVSVVALAANIYCLYLLSRHKEKGVHMKASYICSSTDVMANAGVIAAGILVILTNSRIPDLIIGLIIVGIVMRGARSILKIAE